MQHWEKERVTVRESGNNSVRWSGKSKSERKNHNKWNSEREREIVTSASESEIKAREEA